MNNGTAGKPSVLVMMATYNGEKYVTEQIESILTQEDVDVTLLISDDGSSDMTPQICSRFACSCSNVKFSINEHNKGLARNFMDMLYATEASSYDFFAFSDQDDYWLPNKLKKAIVAIRYAGDGPRLYYSDVCNVDENLNGGSNEYYAFKPYVNSLGLLLTVNWASGCTMVFNSAFATILQHYVPAEWPRIHDGWVHLVARSINAQVPDLDHSYIKRRISGDNQVGERELGVLRLNRIVKMPFYLFSKGKNPHWATRTVSELLNGYSFAMDADSLALCKRFVCASSSISSRIKLAFDSNFKSPYPVENALYPIKMILNKY